MSEPTNAASNAPQILHRPTVQLLALTQFFAPTFPPQVNDWKTDTPIGSQQLIEAAGRSCYESWHNPAGRSNADYIGNMLDHGHLSVIEHATASFYVTGVSRSLTHELVRHRHLSFSQRSQRYVSEDDAPVIEPDIIANDPELHQEFVELAAHAQRVYRRMYERLQEIYADIPDRTSRRKLARQAARSVLPNATETRIVVSGNFRAWRHFIRMRASEHADIEIRILAIEILKHLQREAPSIFGDYEISDLPDGTQTATTKHVYE